MDLTLSETQRLARDAIRDYLDREVPFTRVREVENATTYDEALWRGLAAQGWLGLPFPEERGGSGGSLTDLAVMVEALTRRAVLIPIVEAMTAGVTIQRYADDSVAGEVVPRIAGGEMLPVPAVVEGTDQSDGLTTRVQNGRLSGAKLFVDYGQQATHHLVSTVSDGELGLYLADVRLPGVNITPLRTIGRIPQCNVRYDKVPAVRIAGPEASAFLTRAARALTSVQCLACAQQALDMTVEYVGMRVQFGRPIGSFQAVQHHCADMATLVEATRFLTYEAVWLLDQGQVTDQQLSVAKVAASRTVTHVTMQAHQLHGGIGFIEEYDLYFFSLRGKHYALAWGSAEECLTTIGDAIEEPERWFPIAGAAQAPEHVAR